MNAIIKPSLRLFFIQIAKTRGLLTGKIPFCRYLYLVCGLILSIATIETHAAGTTPQWRVWKQQNGITISYQKHEKTGLYKLKAETELKSTLSGFMLFLQDTQHIPDWLDNANKSEVLAQLSDQENVFITYFDGFLWVKPRHLIIHSKYRQAADLSIDIDISVAPEQWQNYQVKNSIAMQVIEGHWHITPVSTNKIRLSYQVLIDPKGKIPHWLANKVALSRMMRTLKNIKQQLPKSKWQSKLLKGIKNKP